MTIDPRFGFWFSIAMAIVSALGICGTQLTTLFGDIMANKILAAIVMLNVINSAINAILHAIPSKPGAASEFALGPKVVPVILLALILGVMALPGDAHAQIKTPQQIINDLRTENARLSQKVSSVVAPTDSATALPCDFKMLTKLTPENLIPTQKACLSDVAQKLVNDTQRALASAKAYVGPNGGNPGDGDGINCLTPGLAIFKAGVQVPAVPAVMSADGTTVVTPEVPAQDPGPILLYQKYREFTLAGGLTACQTWFNGPINATAAAGVAGAGTIVAGAAILAPK